MNICDNITNVNSSSRKGNKIEWIIIHNTYNKTSASGTAWNNTVYFKDYYRGSSAHYFIDNGDIIWRCVPDNKAAWSIGTGPRLNGATNENSINIEVCETYYGYFTENEIRQLRELVQYLMEKYNIDSSHVCRHYDATGKTSCPRYYVSNEDEWTNLWENITEGDYMSDWGSETYRPEQREADWGIRGKGTGDMYLNNTNAVHLSAMASMEGLKETDEILEKVKDIQADMDEMRITVRGLMKYLETIEGFINGKKE